MVHRMPICCTVIDDFSLTFDAVCGKISEKEGDEVQGCERALFVSVRVPARVIEAFDQSEG
jgi:hypothetical protein